MLFTFPLRYWFTIGIWGVFSLTGWCRQIHARFLRSRATQDTARPHWFLSTGLSPALAQLSRRFNLTTLSKCSPITLLKHASKVWALPSSLATTLGIIIYFLFLSLLRCFSSGGWLSFECYTFSIAGCPIRKPGNISLVCSSSRLIAAYHVLLRLSDPRHPPCALIRFKKFWNCSDVTTTINNLRSSIYDLRSSLLSMISLSQYVKELFSMNND